MKLNISKKDIKTNGGITLIALVITIIVLLILAGVAIATLTGDNGLLTKARYARNTNIDKEIEEEVRLAWNKAYIDGYMEKGTNIAKAIADELGIAESAVTLSADGKELSVTYKGRTVKLDPTTGKTIGITVAGADETPGDTPGDTPGGEGNLPPITAGQKAPDNSNAQYKSGNYTAIIPAGFTVSNQSGESSIETGLVIRDDDGNEFVWIPVGIPWKTDSTKTITLSRYKFDDNGDPDDKGANTIDNYFRELASSTLRNAVAKNIEDFKTKTNAAGGFWIGRYEARTTSQTARTSKNDTLTSVTEKPENSVYNYITQPNASAKAIEMYTGGKLVEKPGAQVFNYITQNKASELSRTMYSSNNYFESDLVNSYAWDTATLFLQEYDNRTYNINTNSNYKAKYSRQIRLSTGFKNTGTNASSITDANKDKICNVYDMADNCYEWTTETYSSSSDPCVGRGGCYYNGDYYTSNRYLDLTTNASVDYSFRPVLYIK